MYDLLFLSVLFCQMNEMAVETHHRKLTTDHASAELMCLKSQLQQTNTQLSDAQRVLVGKVRKTAFCFL